VTAGIAELEQALASGLMPAPIEIDVSPDAHDRVRVDIPLAARLRLRAHLRVPAAAGHVPLDRDRDQGDRAQPALGRRRLRRARAVFQHGWGENLLGFESNGGIAPWLPLFLFVILFGLSMDYHVFILSRIREAYDRGMSTDDAVAHGIKTTAGASPAPRS
jgi:hypothetical protein